MTESEMTKSFLGFFLLTFEGKIDSSSFKEPSSPDTFKHWRNRANIFKNAEIRVQRDKLVGNEPEILGWSKYVFRCFQKVIWKLKGTWPAQSPKTWVSLTTQFSWSVSFCSYSPLNEAYPLHLHLLLLNRVQVVYLSQSTGWENVSFQPIATC